MAQTGRSIIIVALTTAAALLTGCAVENEPELSVGEAAGSSQVCTVQDIDSDGFTANTCGGIEDQDCDDFAAAIHPDAAERCGDGIDNDCDGDIDEGCDAQPPEPTTEPEPVCVIADGDNDGYGVVLFDESDGTRCSVLGPDCNDRDANSNPAAEERCGDGLDNDCDGDIDEGCEPELCDTRPAVDKACTTDADCEIGLRVWDCCGSVVAVGVSSNGLDDFAAFESSCGMQASCDCRTEDTLAEDGMAGDLERVEVRCVANTCLTGYTYGSCPHESCP